MAEADALKASQCRFESDRGYRNALLCPAMDLQAAESVVGEIVRYARTGHQSEALGQLLDLTGSEEPAVAWLASAGCLTGMWWSGVADAASEMVMRIVERFGDVSVALELPQHVLFPTAVIAGGVYDDLEIVPRLFEMASLLPAGSAMSRRALWSADYVVEHGGAAALPGNLDPTSDPLDDDAAQLLTRPLPGLTDREVRRLWLAAVDASRRDVLLQLWDSGVTKPWDHTITMWRMAQVLVEAGRPAEAEQALIATAATCHPGAWDPLPVTVAVNPGLRPAITERVTEVFWTQPIGDGLVLPASGDDDPR